MKKFLLIIIPVMLFGCRGEGRKQRDIDTDSISKTRRDATVVDSSADTLDSLSFSRFGIYYDRLFTSILQGDAESFNQFIHPDYGLAIIESSGAMPEMRNGKDISRFRTISGKSLFELDKSKFSCELREEELPKVDCDTPGFYSKSGCFTKAVNTFKDEKLWMYAGLQDKEQKLAAAAAEKITRTVINTSGFRYYFAKMGNHWYLLFLDLRVPCNA